MARFTSCLIASRFIDTAEEALAYYALRFVGDRKMRVSGVETVIRFNHGEIHLFTEDIEDGEVCPPAELVCRPGRSREVRRFCRDRARRLDDIPATLASAEVFHAAKDPGGRIVYGPPAPNAARYAVVIVPDKGTACTWYVRTAYPVTADEYRNACGTKRRAPWPPK